MSGGNETRGKRVMIQQITTPRITPVAVPATPTIVPYQMKMRRIIDDSAPIEARIPISFRFSCTVMISVETMLNVDTNTISPMTMNSTSCWILSIEKSWRFMPRQLFSMLKIQQLVLFIVIGLIVFVSTFNIVSTLIMTVHEKRKEIGILASMGAESSMISRIFVWYGTMVGLAGTLAGIVLGVAVCWIMTEFHLLSFPPEIAEVYFVSSIPFVTRVWDIAVIAIFSIAVSFLATVFPSMRAARLNPIEALRHE